MATSNISDTSVVQPSALFGVTRIRVIETSASKDYYISTNLLNREAPRFRTNLEMQDNTLSHMEVGDCDIATFDIFILWLNREKSHGFFRDYPWPSGMAMIQLWLFALRHMPPRHSLFAAIRAQADFNIVPTVTEINYAYEHTVDGCHLRRAIVRAFCNGATNVREDSDRCCAKFLADAFKYMRAKHESWIMKLKLLSNRLADHEGRLPRRDEIVSLDNQVMSQLVGGAEFGYISDDDLDD